MSAVDNVPEHSVVRHGTRHHGGQMDLSRGINFSRLALWFPFALPTVTLNPMHCDPCSAHCDRHRCCPRSLGKEGEHWTSNSLRQFWVSHLFWEASASNKSTIQCIYISMWSVFCLLNPAQAFTTFKRNSDLKKCISLRVSNWRCS